MSLKFDLFPIRPLTVGRFRSWLARSEPGAALEYHRGLLILDRSPASELGEDERRTVAKIADAAWDPTYQFCSLRCQGAGAALAGRHDGMIDQTDMEKQAIKDARRPFAEILTSSV